MAMQCWSDQQRNSDHLGGKVLESQYSSPASPRTTNDTQLLRRRIFLFVGFAKAPHDMLNDHERCMNQCCKACASACFAYRYPVRSIDIGSPPTLPSCCAPVDFLTSLWVENWRRRWGYSCKDGARRSEGQTKRKNTLRQCEKWRF